VLLLALCCSLGGEYDSNFLSHEESGNIFYFVIVAIGSKLVQKGEGDRTGSREILYCLFFIIWLIFTGFLC
jgi:hypothetical protein